MQKKHLNNQEGFTLIEIMIGLAITAIVIGAASLIFQSQNRAYTVQSEVAMMQQSLRGVMGMMARELRMANYDPVTDAGGITNAAATTITFVNEIDDVGTLQTVQYRIYDAYGDGDPDIGRAVNGAVIVPLAENIDALEFLYLDEDGNQTANLEDITTINVSILARSSRQEPDFINTFDYFPLSCPQPNPAVPTDACIAGVQWTAANPTWNFDGLGNNSNAFNDNFRRRLLTTTIQLRN